MSQSGIIHLGPTGPSINTITGNPPSAAVGPDGGGNLNLVGLGGVLVTSIGAPANTLNISVSGSGIMTWSTLTAAGPEAGAINHGYIANFAGIAEITLPSGVGSAPVGSVIEVIQLHTGATSGFRLLCPGGVTIYDGTSTATTSLTYSNVIPFIGPPVVTDRFGSVRLVCAVADTVWIVANERGSTFVAV